MAQQRQEEPTLEEWGALYDAFIPLKELAPWTWMREEMVFAVQDPDTAEMGYVSIIGMRGEALGVLVFLGGEGWYGFQRMREFGERTGEVPREIVFTVPFLQGIWADRQDLTRRDREVIKALGLKFRGRSAWPLFRNFTPGYYPWYFNRSDARFFTHVLERTTVVARRVQEEGPDILVHPEDSRRMLTYVPRHTPEGTEWDEAYVRPLPWDGWVLSPQIPQEVIEDLSAFPQSSEVWQMDLFMGEEGVYEHRGERPYIPYFLVIAEAKSGYILTSELFVAENGLPRLYEDIPNHFLALMWKHGARPQRVEVRTTLMYNLLALPLKWLDIPLQKKSALRAVDTFLRFLEERL